MRHSFDGGPPRSGTEGVGAKVTKRPAPMICVIDDDVSLLRALQRLLGAAGFTVATFRSAEEFLTATYPSQPECLVIDIHLGDSNGFDLLAQLRASGRSIPTIFITGHDNAATRERARREGAAGYLGKPFEGESLLSAIEAAIEG